MNNRILDLGKPVVVDIPGLDNTPNLFMSGEIQVSPNNTWVAYHFGGVKIDQLPDWLLVLLGYDRDHKELISEVQRLHDYSRLRLSGATEQKAHEYLPIDDCIFTLNPEQITNIQTAIYKKMNLDLFDQILTKLYEGSWHEFLSERASFPDNLENIRIFYWFN